MKADWKACLWTTVLAALAGSAAGQEILWTETGGAAGFGVEVAALPDMDGDGAAEVAVAKGELPSFFFSFPSIQYGPSSGGSDRVVFRSGETGATLCADLSAPNTAIGYSLATGVDVTGNGIIDLLAGAPLADGPLGESEAGAVYIRSLVDGAEATLLAGSSEGDHFGESVAILGDLTADGVSELAVGVPGSGGGRVEIYSGATYAILDELVGPPSVVGFGARMAAVPDITGDDERDLVVCAPASGAGVAFVFASPTWNLMGVLVGEEDGDRFGHSVASIGDVDGDGTDDFAVGAPARDRVYLFSGATLEAIHLDRDDLNHPGLYGWSVSAAGDFDGDGRGDFAVGAPLTSRVFVHSGRDGRVLSLYASREPDLGVVSEDLGSSSSALGFALSGLGDVDGDGAPELAVGAPLAGLQPRTGRVVVMGGYLDDRWMRLGAEFGSALGDLDRDGATEFGLGRGTDLEVREIGANGDSQLLWRSSVSELDAPYAAVCVAWDHDGDGVRDVAVGQPEAVEPLLWPTPSGSTMVYAEGTRQQLPVVGRVRIFSGDNGELLHEYCGTTDGQRFGFSLSSIPDVDGDGKQELIVGAPGQGNAIVARWSGGCFNRSTPPFGAVFVIYSGSGERLQLSGSPLTECVSFRGEYRHSMFGFSVLGLDDVSGDGVPDFAVGAPYSPDEADPCCPRGRISVHSGLDGGEIYSVFGVPQRGIGFRLAGGSGTHFDGDGICDFITSSQQTDDSLSGPAQGGVTVLSGTNGTTLHSWLGQNEFGYGDVLSFGYAIDAVGDFDGDGIDDIAIGDPARIGNGSISAGRVLIRSGTSGADLATSYGGSGWDYLGYSVIGLGDATQDGYADVVLGAPANGPFGRGSWKNSISRATVLYGRPELVATDCNGDGVDDGFRPDLFGRDLDENGEPDDCQSLRVNRVEVSVGAGGGQRLVLSAGARHAGKPYVLLGTMSGSEPGFSLGGVPVPLNLDSFTSYVATGGLYEEFVDFVGTLDVRGISAAGYEIGPGVLPLELIGSEASFVGLVLGDGVTPTVVSNPVPLRLVE